MKLDWKFITMVVGLVGCLLTTAVSYGKLQEEVGRNKEDAACLKMTIERLTCSLNETNKQLNIITGYIHAKNGFTIK